MIPPLLVKLILAVVVAVVVGLVCILVGAILASINVPPAEAVGHFLNQFAWAIGILAGLWYFFTR